MHSFARAIPKLPWDDLARRARPARSFDPGGLARGDYRPLPPGGSLNPISRPRFTAPRGGPIVRRGVAVGAAGAGVGLGANLALGPPVFESLGEGLGQAAEGLGAGLGEAFSLENAGGSLLLLAALGLGAYVIIKKGGKK